ncbi:hypothetical protein [Streptomyces gardneri]|uniref:Uncharacterized protein n=1 Tax=Streptomyces gardneri TaxID=66892 RepID=A0A4Y3RSU6_9ACTN|nr:hypothetical protein [Streptomyces gardneri]GEB59803.1 hypothetical protein SGA01_54080 [Streptomyces gardneri]GHH04712.1 hypothetical protein GCM10017674_43290 [Streptomyces gardneri]
MTTPITEDRQAGSSDSDRKRRRGGLRPLLFAATALTAVAAGVAGTLLYQRFTAPDTSAVDAQAAEIAEALRGELTTSRSSGGATYGGQFTEGTLVAQVQAHGGVLLSADTDRNRAPDKTHTAEVMLGLVPPSEGAVAAAAYPVRCYRYTFGVGAYSVKQSDMTCPAGRTDRRPGSLAAQMGVLLTRQPTGAHPYRPKATEGYAHTPQGAADFLEEERVVTAGDEVSAASGRTDDHGAYVLALRINDVCHYLRMASSPTASDLIPLWAAPADEQEACDVQQAVAAAELHGTDPTKQG